MRLPVENDGLGVVHSGPTSEKERHGPHDGRLEIFEAVTVTNKAGNHTQAPNEQETIDPSLAADQTDYKKTD